MTPGAFYADEIVHAIDASQGDRAYPVAECRRFSARPEGGGACGLEAPPRGLVCRVDQAPLPAGLEYFLNTSQWLDASGGDIARSMPKLIAAVRVAIQAPVVTPQCRSDAASSRTITVRTTAEAHGDHRGVPDCLGHCRVRN